MERIENIVTVQKIIPLLHGNHGNHGNNPQTLHQWGESDAATLISENGHDLLTQFDTLYDELSEQSHAITPSNKKKPVKRPDPPP